jgi:hypothetical protein
MKKINFIVVTAYILSACLSPSVDVPQQAIATLEVPLTSTSIPTPTLHPEFTALQESIAAASERFSLNSADGRIYDSNTPIPGIIVTSDGIIILTVEGETVIIDPANVSFNDEKGIAIEGYHLDKKTDLEWRESVSFNVCSVPEKTYRDCPLDLENDIFSGDYDDWLDGMKQPFDWDQINNVSLVYMDGWGRIQYNPNTDPNFSVPGSQQQHKDVTAGYIVFEFDGKVYDYILVPLEVVNPITKKSYWVKTVIPIHDRDGNLPKNAAEDWVVINWGEMRYLPIFTKYTVHASKFEDPLVRMTFQKYPDLPERFEKFASGEDMSVLSEPDIILLTEVIIGNDQFK